MTNYLVIVESPSKCKKIEQFLNETYGATDQYKCVATEGHFRTLDSLTSVDWKHRSIQYTQDPKKQNTIKRLQHLATSYSPNHIYLATDDDREGEAIAWHVCEVLGLPVATTPRIVFHEITASAVCDAVQHPCVIDTTLVMAQRMRQVIDLLIGFRISPYLWKITPTGEKSLSVGRCQTPALRLLVERENDAASHPEQFRIVAKVFDPQIAFGWTTSDANAVDALFAHTGFFVYLGHQQTTRETTPPPKPFKTSTLLQTASTAFHWSSKEIMSTAQLLYQGGYITYHRTDSQQFADTFWKAARSYLNKQYGPEFVATNTDRLIHAGRLPHEAIRVTSLTQSPPQDKGMRTLYHLIRQRTIESCMSEYQFHRHVFHLQAPTGPILVHDSEEPIHLGWKRAIAKNDGLSSASTSTSTWYPYLMAIAPMSVVPLFHLDANTVAPPGRKYYTESTLIQRLEELGIGRPSTYSTIVHSVLERGYVAKQTVPGDAYRCRTWRRISPGVVNYTDKEATTTAQGQRWVVQPLGKTILHFVDHFFHTLFTYDYTKSMEIRLDAIEETTAWEIAITCMTQIQDLARPVQKVLKTAWSLLDTPDWELISTFHGLRLRHRTTGEFKTVRADIVWNWEEIQNQQIRYHDIVEVDQNKLGEFEGKSIELKKGKFGWYLQWGDKNVSLKHVADPTTLTTAQAISILSGDDTVPVAKKPNPKILETWSADWSVRKGKYGPYLYYKTAQMGAPKFFTLSKALRSVLQDMSKLEKATYAQEHLL